MDQDKLDSWLEKRKLRRLNRSAEQLAEGILNKDRDALSTAITLVESTRREDRKIADELMSRVLPHAGNSIRIGITGVPGVGKSTFIEAFGKEVLRHRNGLAVLAIDPTSGVSGGSILGDKTRMDELSRLENVFIRPTAAGKSLGGVAEHTREAIILCEAFGFEVILVETVGVGQSETMVHAMTDFFLLLMLAGAGDELQGIKRGIMELADCIAITKSDGDNVRSARNAVRAYKNAIHLFPPDPGGWIPRVMDCSAYEHKNIDVLWETVDSYRNTLSVNGWFEKQRVRQNEYWFTESVRNKFLDDLYSDLSFREAFAHYRDKVRAQEITSFGAAEELFRKIKSTNA